MNSFSNMINDKISIQLFAFEGMFNHGRKANLKPEYLTPSLVFMFADRDIKKGEELVIEYCTNVKDEE